MSLIEKIALKPCPFCGGDAHTGTTRYSRPLDDTTWLDGTPITQAFFVSCVQCGSCTNVSVGRQTEAEAIAAWNNRAALTAIMGEGDGVQEWECFCDAGYFDMWCVREVGERRFGHGYHVASRDEAEGLRDHLNEQVRHRSTAAAAERGRMGWQPIETVPQPGTIAVLYTPDNEKPPFEGLDYRYELAVYRETMLGQNWHEQGTNHLIAEREDLGWDMPTHWMPLPAPPADAIERGEV